ncbi:MAG: hypothetical protein EPO06_11835 [Burkholderiaceae bacterium]|nr:MAG: hypothetical protein EPO06_11835 [Burkholderiaceae bacterium]
MGRQVDRAAALAAASAILERRLVHGRPEDAGQLPDDGDLAGVVRYVRTYRRVPVEVLRADALDALRIVDHLEQQVPRDRYALAMLLHEQCGWPLRQLAEPLGIHTHPGAARQAVKGALQRLRVAAGGDKDTAVVVASPRRQAVQGAAAVVAVASLVRAIITALVRYRALLDGESAAEVNELAYRRGRAVDDAAVAELAADLRIVLLGMVALGAPEARAMAQRCLDRLDGRA